MMCEQAELTCSASAQAYCTVLLRIINENESPLISKGNHMAVARRQALPFHAQQISHPLLPNGICICHTVLYTVHRHVGPRISWKNTWPSAELLWREYCTVSPQEHRRNYNGLRVYSPPLLAILRAIEIALASSRWLATVARANYDLIMITMILSWFWQELLG